jgi:hypothetical protein
MGQTFLSAVSRPSFGAGLLTPLWGALWAATEGLPTH